MQVVAWLLGIMGGRLRLVEPSLPAPHTSVAAAAAALPLGRLPGTAPPGGWRPASVATAPWSLPPPDIPTSVPLRAALEAHRPGCTYPAVLDGPWWGETRLACLRHNEDHRARMGAGGGRDSGKGADVIGGRTSSSSGHSSSRSASVLRLLGGGSEWSRSPAVSWASIRSQLESCCLRVAPGPTYEGFFLAQFVKE